MGGAQWVATRKGWYSLTDFSALETSYLRSPPSDEPVLNLWLCLLVVSSGRVFWLCRLVVSSGCAFWLCVLVTPTGCAFLLMPVCLQMFSALSLHELTACIYYKLAIDRGLRGCDPDAELLSQVTHSHPLIRARPRTYTHTHAHTHTHHTWPLLHCLARRPMNTH